MTANNIPPRWYMVSKTGVATLCVDEYDARQNVIDADVLYPNNAPHTAVQLAPVQPAMPADAGWKEAAIAWEVCASLHREYCEGKDPFFKTRQGDFVRHAAEARRRIEGES